MRQQKANKNADTELVLNDGQETVTGVPMESEHSESALSLSAHAKEPSIPPFRQSLFSEYTWDELDETSLPLIAALDPQSRRMYEKIGRVPALRRYNLGTFRVSDHHSISFETVPALGEVSYSELMEFPAGAASPLDKTGDDDSISPLVRFLQLSEKNVPVPLVLAEFDDRSDDPAVEKLLSGRVLVDAFDDYGRPAALVSAAAPPTSAAAVWTCFSGGDDAFSSAYCESKGIWYCDNDAWLSLTRSSGDSKRYVSHSRVAACGGGFFTYVEHQYRYWSWWKAKWVWTTVQYPNSYEFWQTLGPGEVKYWKHVSSKKRRRKVKIWTYEGSYFRAWSAFYN